MILVLLATVVAPATAGVPRLRRMVVIGDSLLAGFGSGGLVAHGRVGQVDSAPARIARRARVPLPQPLMAPPGVPPPYAIVDANRNGRLEAGDVRRRKGLGFRSHQGTRARNLAVPGENIDSIFEEIPPQEIAGDLVRGGDVDGREALKFLILGLPLQPDGVSQVSRARDLKPSFILVWIGNNDVLPMASRTDPTSARQTPAEFATRFRQLLNALADTGAGMAVANLPDPTGVARLRRAAGEVTSCTAPDGTTQLVDADDLLNINLAPTALPVPPCGRVLSASERAQVRTTVVAFNAEIAAAIADVSARRDVRIAPVDMLALFDQAASAGVDIDGDGSPDVARGYLGGLFSLDGVHPTRTGQALIANAFIDAINTGFGELIPRINVRRVAARDRLVGNRFRPAGEPPFGLIHDDGADVTEAAFDRIERNAGRLGDRLRDRLGDIVKGLF
jgi:lysophospholipase L1-like esterase